MLPMPDVQTNELQATNTATPIAVIADDQDHLIHLPSTYHDSTLSKSMISKSRAFATHGRIKATSPTTLVTSYGQHFTSSTTITLRWRYDAGMQSFQEKFWVVDGVHDCDAILRKDIETPEDGNGNAKAFPVFSGKPGSRGKADREQKQLTKEQRDAEYQKEIERQKQQMKKGLDSLKPVPPVR